MNPRLLRPTPTGFDPRRIAGLAGWWDSTDNSTITTDTGVSAWRDKVNSYSLGQSTGANQPTLSTINGNQAFDYNGSSQFLESTAAGLLAEANGSSVNDTTIFYVGVIDAVSSSAYAVAFGSSTSANPAYAALQPIQSGSVWRAFWRGDTAAGQVVVSSTAGYVTGTPYVVVQSTAATIVGRVNGSQVLSTSNTASTDSMTTTRLGVGALARNTVASYWDGRIGDVLIYNRVLTTAEIQRVERWLAGKFGVTLA
jgi:hypothetical protein